MKCGKEGNLNEESAAISARTDSFVRLISLENMFAALYGMTPTTPRDYDSTSTTSVPKQYSSAEHKAPNRSGDRSQEREVKPLHDVHDRQIPRN